MLWVVLLSLAFLGLSGLMAAVDAAILSVTRPEIQEMIVQRKRGARTLKAVQDDLTPAIVVIVILTNSINVVGPILVSQQVVSAYSRAALGVLTVVLTMGTIVISEIIPKGIGSRYATEIGRFAARPIRVLQSVLYPLVRSLEWMSNQFTSGTRTIGTEAQIRSLTTIGRRAGHIEQHEGRLIYRAFILNDRSAADIMTPLGDIVAVTASMTIGKAAETVRQSNYSRYPVFGESADQVFGMVMIRDLLEAVSDGRQSESVRAVERSVMFVTAKTRSADLLTEFRKQHMHLAIVKDGEQTIGVVSLEDVLEELVGEIDDERDVEALSDRDGAAPV